MVQSLKYVSTALSGIRTNRFPFAPIVRSTAPSLGNILRIVLGCTANISAVCSIVRYCIPGLHQFVQRDLQRTRKRFQHLERRMRDPGFPLRNRALRHTDLFRKLFL